LTVIVTIFSKGRTVRRTKRARGRSVERQRVTEHICASYQTARRTDSVSVALGELSRWADTQCFP
jgi:hypothetical protein